MKNPIPSSIAIALISGSLLVPLAHAQRGPDENEGMIHAQLVIDVSSVGEAGGAVRLGAMHVGSLRAGQSRHFSLRLPAGKCFVAVGRGGPGIDNLDIALSSGRSVLVRDTEISAASVARWCSSDRPVRARFTVTAFRGAGPYAAAIYVLDAAIAAAHEAELAGETALSRLASLTERHGRGMRPVTIAARETLNEGEQLDRSVPLRPGRCYRVLAAAERGIADLDLALVGPGGATLQRDASDDGTPTLGVVGPLCPATPGEYRLSLSLESGDGAFAWQVFGSVPRGTSSGGSTTRAARYRVGGTGSGYVSGLLRQAHREHADGGQPITDLLGGRLAAGERAEHRFRVTGGKCYAVLAAAVPSARDVDLEIRDPYGNQRGVDDGRGSTPHVRVCPRVAGSYVASVYMFQGYGAYGLQIFVGDP